jgi:hypothetical protein
VRLEDSACGKKDQFCKALVDSGAAASLINNKVLARVRHRKVASKMMTVRGITGSSTRMVSWYLVELNVVGSSKITPHLMMLDNTAGIDMLLGMSWLKEVNAKIHIADELVLTNVGTLSAARASYKAMPTCVSPR